MSAGGSTSRARWLLTLPALIALAVFFVVPLGYLFFESFRIFSMTGTASGFTFGNYIRFLSDGYYLFILFRTFYFSAIVSIICLIMGYPIALLMALTVSPRLKTLLLFAVIAPLLVSVVVRTFGWFVVLGEFGVFNKTLQLLGVTDPFVNRTHLFNEASVILGLVHVLLPIMVLSLYSALQKLPPRLVDAARNLGASPMRAFAAVTLPLSMPGIVAGTTTVFALAGGSYVSPAVLGGSKVMVMSMLSYQQTVGLANWQFGSAVSVVLLVSTLSAAALIQQVLQRSFKLSFSR